MTGGNGFGRALATAVVFLLFGCGEKAETLVASARDYLDRNDPTAATIQLKNALQKNPASAEARFLLGRALLATGDAMGAEVELRKALENKYPADQVVPLMAQTLLATGQAKKLITELAGIKLTTAEARSDLLVSVATAQAVLGQPDKAKASLEAALAEKPDYPRAMLLKARMLFSGNDIAGALSTLESVLNKDGRNYEAWGLRGEILDRQGKADESLAAYRKALEIKPDFAGAYVVIIGSLMKHGRMDEARVQLDAMKKALPKSPQTMFVEAQYLFQRKEYKRALEVAQSLVRILPDNQSVLLLTGAIELELNSLVQAENNLARVVKRAPDSALARRLLATTYLRSAQPAKALATVEPMLTQIDDDAAALSLVGDIYMQTGDLQKADQYFAKAASLDPGSMLKQTKVALAHLAEGRGDSALAELERIASTDAGTTADMALIAAAIRNKDFPRAMKAIDGLDRKQTNSPLVFALRGAVLIAKGDVAGGRKSYESALAAKPDYFPAAASLAGLDMQDNRPDDARKRFERVLAADPKNVQAGLALADLKARNGAGPDEVAAQLAKTIQSNPDDPTARLALIRLYAQNKDLKKAEAAAQDATAAMPDRVEIVDALARIQLAAGETSQALATCGKLVTLMPGPPQPYLCLAEVESAAKNQPGAIADLRKALDMQPDLLQAQRGLIVLYLQQGNYRDAQDVANEVKRQRPNAPVGYSMEGDIAVNRKAWAEASTAYRAGLRAAPGTTELAIKLHGVLRAGGNVGEAEKFASGWLADHPKDAGFRMAMAETAIAKKDYPLAVRHYQSVLLTQPNNPLLLNNMAWVLGQLKDAKALEYAEKAVRLAPDQPAFMETLGTLLTEKGDIGRGLDLLQKASDLAPQSPGIRLSLARAQIKAGKRTEARKNLEQLASLGEKFLDQPEVARLLKEVGN